jgi:hypothetical protein
VEIIILLVGYEGVVNNREAMVFCGLALLRAKLSTK